MPRLAGPGPHQGRFVVLADDVQAPNFIFEHHAVEILGEKQVGAAAQHQLGCRVHLGQGQQGPQLFH